MVETNLEFLAVMSFVLLYIPESSEWGLPVHPHMHREALASYNNFKTVSSVGACTFTEGGNM